MDETASAALRRAPPLAARETAAVALLQPATRLSLRGDAGVRDLVGPAFGCALPAELCRAARADDRAALCLGPDEWLLLAPGEACAAIGGAVGAALAGVPHSLVDVSHRQAGFEVSGPGAADLLNTGCPLDLHPTAFPVGMATRTLLAKAEVTLWRQAPERFRLEVARSFAAYAFAFLRQAERGLG